MSAVAENRASASASEKRAQLAERLRRSSEGDHPRPLSFSQQRLWFLDQLEPNSPLYNVPAVVRLTGILDVPSLNHALQAIVERHEVLRSRFESVAGTPMAAVSRESRFKVLEVERDSFEAARQWYLEEVKRPFNLSASEPLLRAALVRIAPADHFLVLNMHHIVSDEWSFKVLFRELQELYTARLNSRPPILPTLNIQYADYAAWQRRSLDEESMRKQLFYWKEKLSGALPMTELLTDHPRGRTPTYNGRSLTQHMAPDLKKGSEELAAKSQSTPFMVFIAAFAALVRRYTGVDGIILATPIAGRNRMETEGLIGFFVNTLLLRADLSGNPAFSGLLQRIRSLALDAYANQDLPLEKLVEALKPERSLNPLVFTRLMFAHQTRGEGAGLPQLPGLKAEWIDVDTGTAKFDLTFVVQDIGTGLALRAEYNSDLFDERTVRQLFSHYENLLRGIVENPEQRLSELPLLDTAERRQLLVDWNDNTTSYPRQQCIHELFELQARQHSNETAVVFAGESLTYGELNARSNQLAHYLRSQHLEPGAPVAICVERSIQMAVGFLGILKAGGAYVPLDSAYPKERLAFMLDDTRASILLTVHDLTRRFPHRNVKSVCLDTHSGLIASQSPENPPNHSKPDDVAYIIYTSGSTGQPKGVAVPHQAVNRLVFKTNYIELDSTDRIAQVSNISFDAATFEIWGALLNGGQLRGITTDVALSPNEFAGELREQGITAMFLTSALFSHLAFELPGAFSTLRTLIAGGEALDPKAVRAVLKKNPSLRLVNGYGPTENTTFTCCALLRDVPEDAASVPVGRPISNTRVYILDEWRNPVPIGVAGELYTGGDGLARGYWNRPELTAEKFILHQFAPDAVCQYLYRTGDQARYLREGNIEFLGRADSQIKIRGFRVELGEIEAALSKCPRVKECVVKSTGAGAGETRLIAYFTATGKRPQKPGHLRTFLEERLPEYMVPSAFVQMEKLPLTQNGKVDRRALPDPDRIRPALEKKYASPRDAIELQLTKIWENVLGVEPIGIEDRFFELGGHSLLAVRVVAQIEKAFGKKLPLIAIFLAPTIEKLAERIRNEMRGGNGAPESSVVALQPKGSKPPFFFVHGAGGGMFWGYVNLAQRLGTDQPVYGLTSRGLDGRAEFESIEQMAAHYIGQLRSIQPNGPYYLGGYCFGGNVAFEMARQLDSQGEKVALLALFNCAPPNSNYLRPQWTAKWCARLLNNLLYWIGYCRQWTREQRRDFIRWKWSRLKAWLTPGPQSKSAEASQIDADKLIDLASLPEQQRGLWQAHIRALMNFHPKPYSGRVQLFRSPGHPLWCSFEPDYGWGELAHGGVSITIVSGAHEKILEEPWVGETAEALKIVLDQTREGDLEFWKRELAGAPVLLELPAARSRPAARTGKIRQETKVLPAELTDRMKALDPSLLAVAALSTVLHRYSGQEDILVGLQVAEEQKPNNIVVLRSRFGGDLSGERLLDQIHAARKSALQHAELPFEKVVAELCPTPDPAFHPLVQYFFTSTIMPGSEGIDLRLSIIADGPGASIRLDYAEDLFEQAAMQRMLGHIETVLSWLATEPAQPLSQLSILTPAESDLILNQWTRTEKKYPIDKTLIQLFEEQCAQTPNATALVCGTTRLSYQELCLRSRRVARQLQARGVGINDRVGICLERSEDMVAGILGTLQAGGAYVPLDPAYPKARLEYIARAAGMKVLLTRPKFSGLFSTGNTPLLCAGEFSGESEDKLTSRASASDLAYVLYTSGSTGQPKGVAIENRSVVAFVSWARSVFTSEELSGVLASTSICFDLSVFELFVPLCCGGRVILSENALALPALSAAAEVTLINTVPSAIRELLRINGVPPSVCVVNLAGEPLQTAVVDQIYSDTSVKKVYDLYGPTETTTYSTFALRKSCEPATIGRPLSNEQVYIFDKQMQPMPVGIPGDLYIGGAGLARGYLNRPDLTAERFLSNPHKPGERLYKTGDLARWREDGSLVYLGRSDHQVKIRGFRIELGEIESALKCDPNVRDAIVVVREDRPGDKRLAAHVVFRAGQQSTADELRSCVARKLPQYMVPAYIVILPQLPMTPNGKVDRQALPAPNLDESTSREFDPPAEGLESQIAKIWVEVLGLDRVGAAENFLELGGHSLMAIQVTSRLREALDIELPLTCIFEAPTVRELATGITARRWQTNTAPIPELKPRSRGNVSPASFMQEQLWVLHQLDKTSDAYNVAVAMQIKGPIVLTALQASLDAVVRRHEALRTTLKISGGVLVQAINPSLEVKIAFKDLRCEIKAQADEFLRNESHRPFDLESGPLIRATLVQTDEADHALLIVMHHAISDGWSLDILFRELGANYKLMIEMASPQNEPALGVQFADYAQWQRVWMQGQRLDRQLNYWKEKLADASAEVNLPTDFPASQSTINKVGRIKIDLPKQLCLCLGQIAKSEGATPFMVLMTALAITLRKWSGQSDLVLGTVVAGRNRREIEQLIGCFMNFLPLRFKIAGAESNLQALRNVKAEIIDSQTHQDCPFGKIVESLSVQRNATRNPVYNVALLYQNSPEMPRFGNALVCSPIALESGSALLDMRFEANETENGMSIQCEYSAALFKEKTIQLLLSAIQTELENLSQAPNAKVLDSPLNDALAEQARVALARTPVETVLISSTFTAEPIERALRYWLNELEIPSEIKFAPYNQVFQQLLNNSSELATNKSGLNVLLIRLQGWKSASALKEFAQAIRASVARRGAPILVCFCPPSHAIANDKSQAFELEEIEHALQAELSVFDSVQITTSREIISLYPVADYNDSASDQLGNVPYTPAFFTALATVIARKFHALRRPAYKVIALDCDETLWSGRCAEDGPNGIRIDPARAALQQFMRRQRENGKLLVLCSKNDEADVNAVFSNGAPMPLKRGHFAANRINWLPKSENLKSIARELNLGLDSFIFVDDNPVECAEVEAHCPEAVTLCLPDDPDLIPRFLDHCWAFDQPKTTAEDQTRTELYRQNRLREEFLSRSMTFADFIAGLNLEVKIAPATPNDAPRVAQLTQRTNQFNTSGKRRTETELRQLPDQFKSWTVSAKDRFGDYGVVGVIIFETRGKAVVVDTLLLSCRALGKGVEHQMLAELGKYAVKIGALSVDVPFVNLPRNKPTLDFLVSICATNQQPSANLSIFHFPAKAAAAIEFKTTRPIDRSPPTMQPNSASGARPPIKFSKYHSIALDSLDISRIHERIERQQALHPPSSAADIAPQTETERKLCELWHRLLRIERVGIDDDFFELGGHSLLAVRLFAEIEKLTGKKLPLVTIFQTPTIRQLAARIDSEFAQEPDTILMPIQPNGTKPPLYLVHGAGGDVLWGYANLVAHMPPDQPIFAIKSLGQSGTVDYLPLEDMATRYLEAVKARQPDGPYYLGGYCFGGNVAYEMARQLKCKGEEVALVALLDTAPANAGYEKVCWWRPGFLGQFVRNFYYWTEDFRALENRDRRRFVTRKLRTLARKLAVAIGIKPGETSVDLEEVIDPAHFSEHELKLWSIHLRALESHVQQPYSGHVTLFRTRGHPLLSSFAPDLRWSGLAADGVTVHLIPGSHENIFMEPNVQALAHALTKALSETQERAAAKDKTSLLRHDIA